jgi:hypothetical protein
VKAEIDYKIKNAARHIVSEKGNRSSLRDKVLKNIESIQTGKQISEKSLHSLQSRISNISRRTAAQSLVPALEAIEEDAKGEKDLL